jgi:hypothetical protein
MTVATRSRPRSRALLVRNAWASGGCCSTSANDQPAAVSYRRPRGDSLYRAFKIDVFRTAGVQIFEITTFDARLVPAFGLPVVVVDAAR